MGKPWTRTALPTSCSSSSWPDLAPGLGNWNLLGAALDDPYMLIPQAHGHSTRAEQIVPPPAAAVSCRILVRVALVAWL